LRSFQGVFVTNQDENVPASLEKFELKGNYIFYKAGGDVQKAIQEGYSELFAYIANNKVSLKSSAGYQVITFNNGEFITEIYMETN
jgi:hypothetical protein